MANNRKMRKFEGTCYIPGEQLAMMAKYYRGANLNLNLTLLEDDMGLMKDSLEQSCWCSKLDEVDRMKLQHMKGDAWRINHDHHQGRIDGLGSGNCSFSPVQLTPKIKSGSETKCDKGTETVSISNQPLRRDNHDPRYNVCRGSRNYYGDRSYNRPEGSRRGFITYKDESDYQRPNAYTYPVAYSQSRDSENRYRRNFDPDMNDDVSSRLVSEKSDNDIKCAVCKKDVCAVCKNPLRGRPCHCKCVIPNAGLCNECDMQCNPDCVEIDNNDCVSKVREPNQSNLSSLMLMLMSSQMFNRHQNPEPSCRCDGTSSKPISVCSSESTSSSTCTEKVQRIFLYNCDNDEEVKKSKKKTRKDSSDSSSNCNCCKCPKKGERQESPDSRSESPNSQRKKNSNVTKKSGDSMQSEVSKNSTQPKRFKQSSSSPDKTIKRTQQSITSHQPSEKGEKKGIRHSWFRKPLEGSVDQPSSGNKNITNNNKQKRMEDRGGSDSKSQSSHHSERRNNGEKSSQESSVELKDYLLCLPKIKSDLEMLLMRIQDQKPQMLQKLPPCFSVEQTYLPNVRMRSTTPIITLPAADTPPSSGPPDQDMDLSFRFHPNPRGYPNLQSGMGRNQNLPSDRWGEWGRCQGVLHLSNAGFSMDQQNRYTFPSLPSDKTSFETPAKPQFRPTFTQGVCGFDERFSQSLQKPDNVHNFDGKFKPSYKHPIDQKNAIDHEFQSSRHLWTCHKQNSKCSFFDEKFNMVDMNSAELKNTLLSCNQQHTSDFYDRPLVDPRSLVLKDIRTVHGSIVDRTNKELDNNNGRAVKSLDSKKSINIDRSDTVGRNAQIYSNDLAKYKDSNKINESPQNELVKSFQSADSKHTSDQFISAAEVNDQISEDTFLEEGEQKQVFGKQNKKANKELINANQSTGPGQFKVATFDVPSLHFSNSHPQNEKKQVCSREEGKMDAYWLVSKNGSLASIGGYDVLQSRVQSPDVIITGEASTKVTECPQPTAPALSETVGKSADSHGGNDTALPALRLALKEDSRFDSIMDQVISTSKDSFQLGLAQSSAPSSEDSNLPQLPTEPTEYLGVDKDKTYHNDRGLLNTNVDDVGIIDRRFCNHPVHMENVLANHVLNRAGNVAGGIRNRKDNQVAKMILAQEAIHSMVQNMHEVLASIESDSDPRVVTSSNHEDKEGQSFFVHSEYDGRTKEQFQRGELSTARTKSRNISAIHPSTSEKGSHLCSPHQFDDDHFSEVNEDYAELPQGLGSNNEVLGRGCSSETPPSLNAAFHVVSREMNLFLLDSDRSNSLVFTKRLHQSLANEMSSPNLSAVLTPEEYTSSGNSKRTCSPKPLKRRSWIPPP